jgi:hypothetical protein
MRPNIHRLRSRQLEVDRATSRAQATKRSTTGVVHRRHDALGRYMDGEDARAAAAFIH